MRTLAFAVQLLLAPPAQAQRLAAPAPSPAPSAAGAVVAAPWDTWGSYWDLRTWSQGWGGTGAIAPLPQLGPGAQPRPGRPLQAKARAARGPVPAALAVREQPEAEAPARRSPVPVPHSRLQPFTELAAPKADAFKRLAGWMDGRSGGLAELSIEALPKGRSPVLQALFQRLRQPSVLPAEDKGLSDDSARELAARDFEVRIGPGGQAAPAAPAHKFYPDFPKDEPFGPALAAAGARHLIASASGAALERPLVDAPRSLPPLGAQLAPIRVPLDRGFGLRLSPGSASAAGAAPLSRLYVSLKAPSVEDPAAFLSRSVEDLERETGFRMERTLGYRPEVGGPVLIVLGSMPAGRLEGLRRVSQVAGVEAAPEPGVQDSMRDAPRSASSNPFTAWLRSGLPSFFSALLLAFPWVGALLRRLTP